MLNAIISINDKDLMKILRNENNIVMDRSSIEYFENKIEITAKDIVAFKATVNGIIKLIETYSNTSKSVE